MEQQTQEMYLELARIPEHSLALMQVASQGTSFCLDDYVFLAAEDWLVGIGYPLGGNYQAARFEQALLQAVRQTHAKDIRIIAPRLPVRFLQYETISDRYYVVSAFAKPSKRLQNMVMRAQQHLRLEVGESFTPAHRRLWGEFLSRTALPSNVRVLYGRIEALLMDKTTQIELLNAYDHQGHLVACLVLDYAPTRFDTYLLGAHSKEFYVPHASDALFALMLERARLRAKRFVHLGLGVNEGIKRFKRKWGGRPSLRYIQAEWREEGAAATIQTIIGSMHASEEAEAAQQEWEHSLAQRPYRMLWRVDKDGKTSWLGGTAHFFRYSFESAFKRLFKRVDTVLFEGHLDEASLDEVARAGKRLPDPGTCLYDLLSEQERHALARVVRGPEGKLWRFLNKEAENKADVDWYLRRTRPWYAFFSLWCAFLERQNWRYSVDLEAYHVAHSMGKRVLAMEDIEEQLAALESVPAQRAVRHFQACAQWQQYLKDNARTYLAGDLMGMMGTSTEFPTRTGQVVSERDQRFRERMRPYLEQGRCCVLVGTAHLVNLRTMLSQDGFVVTPVARGPHWPWRRWEEN